MGIKKDLKVNVYEVRSTRSFLMSSPNVKGDVSDTDGKTKLIDLPVDVLRLVIEFSGERNPLTATNRHFHIVRRHSYWKFNAKYSRKYHVDEDFRTFVRSRVPNPSIQVSLNLSWCSNITDVSALGGVHTLNLSGCINVTDVSALGGVHTLDLSRCTNITDVSALGGVHTLDLEGCRNITDVSALGGVHTLDLRDCTNITDVSALGGI